MSKQVKVSFKHGGGFNYGELQSNGRYKWTYNVDVLPDMILAKLSPKDRQRVMEYPTACHGSVTVESELNSYYDDLLR